MISLIFHFMEDCHIIIYLNFMNRDLHNLTYITLLTWDLNTCLRLYFWLEMTSMQCRSQYDINILIPTSLKFILAICNEYDYSVYVKYVGDELNLFLLANVWILYMLVCTKNQDEEIELKFKFGIFGKGFLLSKILQIELLGLRLHLG